MNVFHIAVNTFREAVRDKILYVLLVFGLSMILASRLLGWISYGGQDKIMTDLGLFAVWLFAALIAIFIGTGMIFKEIDKRTLYTILAKPIARSEFILGKYAGLLLTTFVNLALLSAILLAYLWFMGAPVTGALFQALGFTFLEMMVLTALAIFFSSTSTPILAAIFTFLLFGFGQLTGSLVDLGVLFRQSAPWVEKTMRAIYLFLPNLHNFNIRQEAVHAAGSGKFWAMSFYECVTVAAYGVSYAAVLLLAAIFFFRRRNL